MMIDGSLKCVEAALKGQAGHRADPNCMNQHGHFPLHEAAESFNVDMIKLLLAHGALTSVRTAGPKVAENLLPLHVAVENTCLYKYLEENLLPNVDHPDYPTKVDDNYIYKLIHLLCLPEMASHAEVLDGVSSILKFYGFCPTGEVINTENLCPYKFSMPNGELSNKNGSVTAKKITSGVADLPSSWKKGGRKRLPRGWTHQYIWLSFFPYWRSVLASRSLVKVYPAPCLGVAQ